MKKRISFVLCSLLAALTMTSAVALSSRHPTQGGSAPRLAPEFVGGPWLNTKEGKPVTLDSRRGKVTLVAFWTADCSNCQANIRPYARLLKKFRSKGVELIAIHTPETKFERSLSKVAKTVEADRIDYPVLIDNSNLNWDKWGVEEWPTLFVIDRNGFVRTKWLGELNWNNSGGEAKIAEAIESLLAER